MKRYMCVVSGMLFAALLIAAGPAFAAPDCGMNTGKAATGAPIPIGTVSSASGVGSFHEADLAVQAYFKCVNANGGILGRPIVYYQEDDQSKLDVAAQAAKKLVEDRGVYLLVGSTSFIECIANAAYYARMNVLEIGEGIPPQCFESKNIAAVNAGARQSGIAMADYARRKLGAKSVVCTVAKRPGTDYLCGGMEQWGKKFGVKVTSIYSDPVTPDYNSLVLQLMSTGADTAMTYGTQDIGIQILSAVEQQDGNAKMKWTAPTSFYTTRFPKAVDGKYWDDKFWVNIEAAPLYSDGPDNQNWWAVEKAYGGKDDLLDSFAQLGYVAARIAVNAMLSIGDPAKINRETVTAAIQNMKPYKTDILCKPWYWGGPDAQVHNANHTTRIVTISKGDWKEVEGCVESPDPGLDAVLQIEKKLALN
jgi:branched-chain amino acid transport system substrate-binding protein